MKLTIIYGDLNAVEGNIVHLNVATEPRKRMVSIELTKEQEEQLKPQKVGISRGKDVFESRMMLMLED